MTEQKTDRRIRRTKRLLLEGLTTLMEEKDISQISVKELADYADINRGTFYLHYKDVYDMLKKIEDDLFSQFQEIFKNNTLDAKNPNPHDTLHQVFRFLKENKDIAKVLIGKHGDLAFINKLKQLVENRIHFIWTKEQIRQDNFEYYCSFVIYGYIGLIENWLKHNCEKSIEEMTEMASNMSLSGIKVFAK